MSGHPSVESADTLPSMTPSPPISLPTPDRRVSGAPPAGLGAETAPAPTIDQLISSLVDEPALKTVVWYLATCHRPECGGDLSQPFRDDEIARDAWAIDHACKTGHVVHLSEMPDPDAPVPQLSVDHQVAALRCFQGVIWRWLCPSLDCQKPGTGARWNGPYPSGQLALASWRGHGAKR